MKTLFKEQSYFPQIDARSLHSHKHCAQWSPEESELGWKHVSVHKSTSGQFLSPFKYLETPRMNREILVCVYEESRLFPTFAQDKKGWGDFNLIFQKKKQTLGPSKSILRCFQSSRPPNSHGIFKDNFFVKSYFPIDR